MHLSLYLDDCADDDILAALLRQAGHQVSTPRIAGTSVRIENTSIMLHNVVITLLTKVLDDFIELHHQWLATNRTHSGILLVYEDKDVSKNMSRTQIVLAIDNLVASAVPIANQIHNLNQWR